MTTQQARAARRTILAWSIRLADERATLEMLIDGDGTPVAHLTHNIDEPELVVSGGTCLRYYNEIADAMSCPCGCVVTS